MSIFDKGIYYSMIKLDDALDKKSPFLFVKVYHKHKIVKNGNTMKPGRKKSHNKKNDELVKSIKSLTDGFNNFKTEFDSFKKETRDNFSHVREEINEVRQDVNEVKQEVKNINNRLDYIVKANKLKDIPRKR